MVPDMHINNCTGWCQISTPITVQDGSRYAHRQLYSMVPDMHTNNCTRWFQICTPIALQHGSRYAISVQDGSQARPHPENYCKGPKLGKRMEQSILKNPTHSFERSLQAKQGRRFGGLAYTVQMQLTVLIIFQLGSSQDSRGIILTLQYPCIQGRADCARHSIMFQSRQQRYYCQPYSPYMPGI